jgi:hypothetical protein
VAKAVDRQSFLDSLLAGRVESEGLSARVAPMLCDVYEIVVKYYADLVSNHHEHYAPGERRLPAACALVSLPLHLVALPATGTLFRQARVLGAARELSRDLAHSLRQSSAAVPAEAETA